MNKVVLMGRLTRDPNVRYTDSSQDAICIARYTLAVDRPKRKNQSADTPTADFISCVAFGRQGEFAEKHLHKGTKLCISGRIQTGSYEKQDGTKVYTTDIVIENQEFAESKNAENQPRNATDNAEAKNYAGNKQNVRNGANNSDLDGFMDIPDSIDEELPFS